MCQVLGNKKTETSKQAIAIQIGECYDECKSRKLAMATNQAAGFLPPSLQKPFHQLWCFLKMAKKLCYSSHQKWGRGFFHPHETGVRGRGGCDCFREYSTAEVGSSKERWSLFTRIFPLGAPSHSVRREGWLPEIVLLWRGQAAQRTMFRHSSLPESSHLPSPGAC